MTKLTKSSYRAAQTEKSLTAIIAGNEQVSAPPVKVDMKIGKNGRPVKVMKIPHGHPPSVRDNVVRIISDCDPVGFLTRVVNGEPIPLHTVTEDGEIKTVYEYPTISQRISSAKYLSDKFLPKISQVAHHHIIQDEGQPGAPGDNQRNFAQIVAHAAQMEDES